MLNLRFFTLRRFIPNRMRSLLNTTTVKKQQRQRRQQQQQQHEEQRRTWQIYAWHVLLIEIAMCKMRNVIIM